MPFPSAVVNGGSRPGSAASQRSCNYKNGLTSSQTLDGTSWVIQKFGGTSVGKFPIQIVDNIVGYVTFFKLFYFLANINAVVHTRNTVE